MNTVFENHAGRTVIRPQGDVTAARVTLLYPRLKSLLAGGVLEIEFDLSQVSFIDSQGIGLLIMCHNALSPGGGRLAVVNACPALLEDFRMMRLDRSFSITGKAEGRPPREPR